MSDNAMAGCRRSTGVSTRSPSAFGKWKQYVTAQAVEGSQFAQTTKGQIQYTDFGSGPCILHAHGSPAGCDIGPKAFRELAEAGFRIVTPSRPGFLGTPLEVGRTPEDQADAFAALLDALGIERAALLAWSGGGPSALQFALRHPERTNSLIMYAALSHRWSHHITPFERLIMSDHGLWVLSLFVAVFPGIRRKFAQDLGLNYSHVKRDPTRLAVLDGLLELLAPASLRRPGTENDIGKFSRLPRYPVERICCPVLVVFSPCDPQLPFSNAKFVVDRVRQAKPLYCTTGGHAPLLGLEGPEVLSRMVTFLRHHEKRRHWHGAMSTATL